MKPITEKSRAKSASKILLACLMVGAGGMHFVDPDFYVKIMPPYLPLHLELVWMSGLCEILLGVLLLVPKTSPAAAWGTIALLVAVFPANIYIYQNQHILPAPAWLHFLRLPMQGAFIGWAFWHTRTGTTHTSESPNE